MFRRISVYEETNIGLPYAVAMLDCVDEEIDDITGDVIGISYPNLPGIVDTIALGLCQFPYGLVGAEVRFLRSALNMTAKDLAAAMGADAATLSRWENGKLDVGQWTDKQVRLSVALLVAERLPHIPFDRDALVRLNPMPRPANVHPTITISENACHDLELSLAA